VVVHGGGDVAVAQGRDDERFDALPPATGQAATDTRQWTVADNRAACSATAFRQRSPASYRIGGPPLPVRMPPLACGLVASPLMIRSGTTRRCSQSRDPPSNPIRAPE
jgi:hypothetical protein